MNSIQKKLKDYLISNNEPQLYELGTIFGEVRKDLSFEIKAKGITVNIDCQDNLTAFGNVFQLKHALKNLIDNAIRYSPNSSTVSILGREKLNSIDIEIIDRRKVSIP